jgi:hypothetical protein
LLPIEYLIFFPESIVSLSSQVLLVLKGKQEVVDR